MAVDESDIAARLIEQLLSDPSFRDRFLRDPVRTCREAGLDGIADDLQMGGGKAMHTLDLRESRSSLAGVMMAAAMEGIGIYEFSKHVVPHIDDLPRAVGDVLSRVDLPALPGGGSLAGSPEPSAPLPEEPPEAEASAVSRNGAAAAAPAAAGDEPLSPELAKAAGKDVPPGGKAVGNGAAPAGADPTEADTVAPAGPRGNRLPEGEIELTASKGGAEVDGKGVAPPAAVADAPAPAGTVRAEDVDPATLGQEGTGGKPTPEGLALLENKNIVFDDVGISDIKAGKIDPRIIGVLTKLSQEHKITVSCMCSDHDKFTAGGSISNHSFGRGLDIAAIDGEIVSPSSPLAREIASELSSFDPSIRPDEIGSPFAINGPGYFTDAAHMNHVHVGFKTELSPDFELPDGLAAGGASAAAPAADVAAPGDAGVAPAAAPGSGDSSLGAAALRIAQTQRGVRETGGANTGPQVDEYLAAAGVSPGNPWCASFTTWALGEAGHKLPGSGWAAVATWVRNAEQGSNGLRLVSAEDARPGDIVAYDFGGQSDFGADGHIGFLDSPVTDGRFTALEGNNADAVNVVPRRVGDANTVFIRVEGDAPAGAAAPPAAAVPPAAAAAAAAAPAAPVAPAAAPLPKGESGVFAAVAKPAAEQRRMAGLAAVATGEENGAPKSASGVFAVPEAAPAAPAAAPVEAAADAATGASGPNPYPGDDAPKEQLAAWMAREAEKRGLPPQLPVMAALVESNLTNVDFGDADSLGYFQMRVSFWDQGEYAGFADDPDKQIDWFLDQAEAVKAQRVSRGQSVTDPGQFGEWIADVERPAEQFRGRYQLRLEEADTLLKSAPGAPVAPAPPVAPAAPAAVADAPAPAGTVRAEDVDPATLGQEGTGGKPTPEGLALLENKNIVFDDVGISDIKAGKIDPRIIGVLTKLSQEHKITVSCMCSDHDKFTAGGSISNHSFGRGLDIAAIDGEIVSPSSPLAREIASELSSFDPSIRPDEIGSPFAINGPGYFTDAAHMNHVHVGFKTELSPDFELPDGLAAGGASAAAPAADVAAPAAPAVELPKGESGVFAAVPKPAAEQRALASAASGEEAASGSGVFAVPEQQPAARAAAPAEAAAAAAAPTGPTAYPGDDAPKEQIAAWMAAEAEKRGIPGRLPVMAALVESNLTNVDFGDADSLGFFQMRVSIWESRYPGFADDPEKQMDWFLDQAEAVKAQRVARGQSVTDPGQFGEWIADVERPAEQFRGRYQLRLDEADALLDSAPQTAPAAPAEPAPAPAAATPTADAVADAAPPAVARQAGAKALAALAEARTYSGTPYRWGGSTPETGFDCSGLVQWAYAKVGIQIPRVTYDQIDAPNGSPVRRAELLPGDLVFFRDAAGSVHHVGISMGGDKFLHAPHTGDVVKVSSLDEPYYKEQFTGGRRFDTTAGAASAAPAAPAAAAVADPAAVAAAQAAVERDAAAARVTGSGVFKAITAQEAAKAKALAGELLDGEGRAVDGADAADGGDASIDRVVGDGVEAPDGDGSGLIGSGDAEDPAKDSGIFAAVAAASDPAAEPVPPEAAPAAPAAPAPADPAAAAPAPAVPAAPAADVPAGAPPDLADVPADYPGDDAGQAALAKWLAKRAEKAGLPPELPVMAALVESGVKNLNFGDADSVGFFQMRLSIWNQGAYAGYPGNPDLQIKWFIDHAVAHKRAQIAAGDRDFGKDPAAWGEWIADVERPAEQFRGRYQLRLAEARRLLR